MGDVIEAVFHEITILGSDLIISEYSYLKAGQKPVFFYSYHIFVSSLFFI
jgi:hypothetical protein